MSNRLSRDERRAQLRVKLFGEREEESGKGKEEERGRITPSSSSSSSSPSSSSPSSPSPSPSPTLSSSPSPAAAAALARSRSAVPSNKRTRGGGGGESEREGISSKYNAAIAAAVSGGDGGGPPADGGKYVSLIRLNMPNGKRVQRRFHKTDLVSCVREFAEVMILEMGLEVSDDFDLVSNYPRKVMNETQCEETSIEDAGFHPQAVLFLRDNAA